MNLTALVDSLRMLDLASFWDPIQFIFVIKLRVLFLFSEECVCAMIKMKVTALTGFLWSWYRFILLVSLFG